MGTTTFSPPFVVSLFLPPSPSPPPSPPSPSLPLPFSSLLLMYKPRAEVAQLYLEFPPTAGEPPKVLRGFDKVWVPQNGTAQATFSLTRLDISIWDPVVTVLTPPPSPSPLLSSNSKQGWVVAAGVFQVLIGSSSRDIRTTTAFEVKPIPVVSLSVNPPYHE